MKIEKAYAIYLSPTGTTGKATREIAAGMGVPVETCDLTLLKTRRSFQHDFKENEAAVVGLPVYAGRIPKEIDDFFYGLEGNGAQAVAMVMYGNRDYNDALLELKMKLEERGFDVIAAAAFVGQHTFSKNIATGRPDKNDLATARQFGADAAGLPNGESHGALQIKGEFPSARNGYDPANPSGHGSFFTIATNDKCTNCNICIEDCPWGAIDADEPRNIDSARCMRCLSCINNCPEEAKYIADEGFPAFLADFESRLNAKRCEPELFLPS